MRRSFSVRSVSGRAGVNATQQSAWCDPKPIGKFHDIHQRHVPFATFDASDVRSMQTRPLRELLLRPLAACAQLANRQAKSALYVVSIHRAEARQVMTMGLQSMSII